MHDEHSPYYYLPGGRGEMGETAEHTVIREVQEELNITPAIIWPLWFNQAFLPMKWMNNLIMSCVYIF